MGHILQFRPNDSELQQAWDAYDAAQLRTQALYRDGNSTRDQRMAAVNEALRLHEAYARLLRRAAA